MRKRHVLHFGTLPPYVPGLVAELLDWVKTTDVRALCGVSPATATRILAKLTAEGKLVKYRDGGHWTYRKGSV